MKRHVLSILVAVLTAGGIAPAVSAGVVMSETSMANSPNGASTQTRTIYVQGNKQKVENPDTDSITDLDKGVVYVVDKQRKRYFELPLRSPTAGPAPNESQEMIHLDKTGHTRTVANQECTEYAGIQANQLEHVAISACVSRKVPGAGEIMAFAQKFSGSEEMTPDRGATEKDKSGGVMLEKQSVVSFRIPDLTQGNAYRTALFTTKTEVKDIKVRALPADTFLPPNGFSRVIPASRTRRAPQDRNEVEI